MMNLLNTAKNVSVKNKAAKPSILTSTANLEELDNVQQEFQVSSEEWLKGGQRSKQKLKNNLLIQHM